MRSKFHQHSETRPRKSPCYCDRVSITSSAMNSSAPCLLLSSRKSLGFAFLFLFSTAFAPLARGGEAEIIPKDSPASKALSFPLSYTGEGFANLSGGYKRGAIYEGLLSVGVQGDLDKLIGWQGGSFLISGIYPHGSSLTDNYTHDFNRVSNIDAYDSVRLYEAWLQQEFVDGKVSLRLGQILADAEFFVSDSGALFLNGAFGAIPLVAQNLNAPVYPVAAPGLRLRLLASESFSVQAGVFSGAGDQATENRHGVDWRLGSEGMLAITEVAYKWNSEKESTGLPGVFKVGGFFQSGESHEAFPDPQSRGDDGGYLVVDQQLWRKPGSEDQGLSGFLRIGGAPGDRNVVPFYFDTGFNFKGLLPGRNKDIAGIGLSYTKLSGNLSDENGEPLEAHREAILEATYKVVLNDWCNVQPDFQYIFNPGASQNAPNAIVVGLRVNLTFQ